MPRSEGFATETSENGTREKTGRYARFQEAGERRDIAEIETSTARRKVSLFCGNSCDELPYFSPLTNHFSRSRLVGAA
jgi:hypothetical protein